MSVGVTVNKANNVSVHKTERIQGSANIWRDEHKGTMKQSGNLGFREVDNLTEMEKQNFHGSD